MSKTNKSITEEELLQVSLPEQTETYIVISHEFAINKVREHLATAGFEIIAEAYRSNYEGTVARGAYHIKQGDDPEMQMMFSWVNSYDKSTKFQCGVGAVNTNNGSYLLTKDMTNFIRKHTGATVLEEVETTIEDQISKSYNFFAELVKDKQAMCEIVIEPQKFGELLGRMYVNAGIITTQQISAIKQEFESPSYNYTTPDFSLWTLYNHILSIIKLSHPKNFFKQLTVIHSIVQTEFDLLNFDFDFDEPEKETESVKVSEEEPIADSIGNIDYPEIGDEEPKHSLEGGHQFIPNTENVSDEEVDSLFISLDDIVENNPDLEAIVTDITIKLGTDDYIVIAIVTDDDDTVCEIKPLAKKEVVSSLPVEIPASAELTAEEIVVENAVEEANEDKTEEVIVQPGLFDAVQESSPIQSTETDDLDFSLEPDPVDENLIIDENQNLSIEIDNTSNIETSVAEETPVAEVAVEETPAVEEAYVEDPAITAILAKELTELLGEDQEFTYILEGSNFLITMADQSMIELDIEYVSMLQDV